MEERSPPRVLSIAILVLSLGLLGAGCGSGKHAVTGRDAAPDADADRESTDASSGSCVTTRPPDRDIPWPEDFEHLTSESDRLLCDALRERPEDEVAVVVSFGRLLTEEETIAFAARQPIRPFLLDARFGSGRSTQLVADSLEEVLAQFRADSMGGLDAERRINETLRAAAEGDEAELRDIERIEADLDRAGREGPRYVGLGAHIRAEDLPTLYGDSDVRYVILTSAPLEAKGVDPETGDWR